MLKILVVISSLAAASALQAECARTHARTRTRALRCRLSLAGGGTRALGSQVDRPAVKPSLQKTLTLRGGLTLEQTSLIGALYNGGFGVTLMANPDLFFGPSGFLPYFSTALGPVAQTFFGKAFGAMLTGIAAMHFLDGPSQSLCKQMAITAALILYPMVLCVMDTANFTAIWKPQIVAHLGILFITAKAGGFF